MNTPKGKINELPDHFKEGSNEKALINMKNMMIIFVSGVVYHIIKQNQKTQEILIRWWNNYFMIITINKKILKIKMVLNS